MAYKIHAIPAADAAGLTAPYDGTAEAVFVDADGNPVDITGGGTASGVADGAVMPKTLSGYDADTGHGKLVKVKADGSGFDFVDDNATPAAGSVTSAMLAANAVNTAAIGDGQVTAAKLAKGVIPAAYTLPAASATALGGVKRGAAVPANAAVAPAAAAASPTKAEYDALLDYAKSVQGTLNALVASLKTSGAIG